MNEIVYIFLQLNEIRILKRRLENILLYIVYKKQKIRLIVKLYSEIF